MILGFIGSAVTITAKYLEELGIVAQVVAGIGGIILMILAITAKVIEVRTKYNALKKLNKGRGKNGKS